MMMACGAILLLMGLVSGALLAVTPFGFGPENLGWVTWALFPAFTLLGYAFLILPARTGQVILVTRVCGGLLMLLATAAGIGLFLSATGMKPVSSTLALWYVLGLGLVLGPAGLAVREHPEPARAS